MSRAWLFAVIACASLGSSAVAAQQVQPVRIPLPDSLRISLGAGVGVVSGPSGMIDGERSDYEDRPGAWPPLMPTAVVRADVPIAPFLLLGVQSTVFYWDTENQGEFGDSGHFTFDVSAVVRARMGFGAYHRHEVVLSVPFGPSFDRYELGPRRFGGKLENEVGWHAGGFAGYQFIRGGDVWGIFGEVGLTYHRLPKTISYPESVERHLYEPYQLFIRGGLILLPFR